MTSLNSTAHLDPPPKEKTLLEQCRDSGQMSAQQEYLHQLAGELPPPEPL